MPLSAMMHHAIRLAQQGLGRTGVNPSVGCVIMRGNQIIGAARTANGGRPHAESAALAMAGADAKGAVVFVTLEPCAHEGETPACARLLIEADIARVIIGQRDPDSRTAGKGIHLLEKAGIAVQLLADSASANLHRGFISRLTRQRPWVTLKTASSADGFIATTQGESQWITGSHARQHGHMLRAQNDAIVTGSGTYSADKPKLNCRLAGLEAFSPKRYLFSQNPTEGIETLRGNLSENLQQLANYGINHVLIEAGSKLSGSFLREGMVDELYWYRAPKILGRGLAAFDGAAWQAPLADRPCPVLCKEQRLDSDTLSIYRFTTPLSLVKERDE